MTSPDNGSCSSKGKHKTILCSDAESTIRHPFNTLGSKQHLINDLLAKYPSVNGKQIATADDVKNVLACHSTWLLAIRCQQLKLHDLAVSWAQQSTSFDVGGATNEIIQSDAAVNVTSTLQLPFYLDNMLPNGATMTANAIKLDNGMSLLFEW